MRRFPKTWLWWVIAAVLMTGSSAFPQDSTQATLDNIQKALDSLREEASAPEKPFPVKSSPLASGLRYSYTEDNPRPQVSAQAEAERFPRAIMVCGGTCPPCLQVKRENPDIVGPDPTFPVQTVDYTSVDLSDFGLSRGDAPTVPSFFILEAPGQIHNLPTGKKCRQAGYKSPANLRAYLAREGHGVSLEPMVQEPPPPVHSSPATCQIREAGDIPAAISGHLARLGGESSDLVGSLFEVDLELPTDTVEALAEFVRTRTYTTGALEVRFPPTLGLTTAKTTEGLDLFFSSPVQVTYSAKRITVEAELHQVSISEDARRYELDLRKQPGAWIEIPDLTIVIQ